MQQEDCMLRRSGTVECWQRNDFSGRHVMAGLVDATALVGGDYHLCALRKTGAVMCWGNRDYLGTGDGNYVSVPVRVGP
jgi:alpha-tubulin suppressor-like RCC1 family protein